MVKLNKQKIRYLVREAEKGKPTELIARELKISQRRVQQLYRLQRFTGCMPILKKERRPRIPLRGDQKQVIDLVYEHHHVGARLLKIALDEDHPGHNISQNKIHAYLKEKGISKPDKKKQKQRKRTRYERKHSGSLVHMDTHYCTWKPGRYLMTCLDDASRKVLATAEVTRITSRNAIQTLKQGIQEAAVYNVLIHAVNTDRGSEFFANKQGKKQKKVHDFVAFLNSREIRHIPSRIKNPQTNGKLERWHQEYEKHRQRFTSLPAFVAWYNDRIHGELRTRPKRAFIHKLRPESLIGLLFREEKT